ncbi:hypothetical protein HK098_005527, partial [Nowakowskiella sp. JEL0407]
MTSSSSSHSQPQVATFEAPPPGLRTPSQLLAHTLSTDTLAVMLSDPMPSSTPQQMNNTFHSIRSVRGGPAPSTYSAASSNFRRPPPPTVPPPDDDEFNPDPWAWHAWRAFITIQIVILLILIGYNAFSIQQDMYQPACDAKMFAWAVAHLFMISVQFLVMFGLLLALPLGKSQWTWNEDARANASMILYLLLGLVLFGQAIMLLVGFSFIKNTTVEC